MFKKCVRWAGACSAPPDPLAELIGRGGEKGGSGKREGEGREGRRKGEDPQCLKCVDAHGLLLSMWELLCHQSSIK